MTAQTATATITPTSTAVATVRTNRTDAECQARASTFLTELIGSPPDDLVWDGAHHLQGHSHLRGHELVVIAARDDQHQTVVLTAGDWDQVRRASTGGQRRALLDTCAIADRTHLISLLGRWQRSSHRLTLAA